MENRRAEGALFWPVATGALNVTQCASARLNIVNERRARANCSLIGPMVTRL